MVGTRTDLSGKAIICVMLIFSKIYEKNCTFILLIGTVDFAIGSTFQQFDL